MSVQAIVGVIVVAMLAGVLSNMGGSPGPSAIGNQDVAREVVRQSNRPALPPTAPQPRARQPSSDGKFDVVPGPPWVAAAGSDRDVREINARIRSIDGLRLLGVFRCSDRRCGFDARYSIFVKPTDNGRWSVERGEFAAIREALSLTPGPHGDTSDQELTAVPQKSFVWYFAVDTGHSISASAEKILSDLLAPMQEHMRRQAQLD